MERGNYELHREIFTKEMKKTMTAVYDTDLKNSLTNILKAEKIQKKFFNVIFI